MKGVITGLAAGIVLALGFTIGGWYGLNYIATSGHPVVAGPVDEVDTERLGKLEARVTAGEGKLEVFSSLFRHIL
jgi:hypothetical protein